MKIYKISVCFFITLVFAIMPFVLFAQPPGPSGCVDPLDPACPIDSGVVLLVAAALVIAFKKAYDAKWIKAAEKV